MRKKYRLIPGKPMTADSIREKYFKDGKMPDKIPEFDWEFHQRIADELPKSFWC